MYWNLELITYLKDAPWPANKKELIEYANRAALPHEVLENLNALDDEGLTFEGLEELWPDYPRPALPNN